LSKPFLIHGNEKAIRSLLRSARAKIDRQEKSDDKTSHDGLSGDAL
jgi:hypothetical protein